LLLFIHQTLLSSFSGIVITTLPLPFSQAKTPSMFFDFFLSHFTTNICEILRLYFKIYLESYYFSLLSQLPLWSKSHYLSTGPPVADFYWLVTLLPCCIDSFSTQSLNNLFRS
jgi:hypothetical protein